MSYLSTGEAAAICGAGVNTIKRWVQKGELAAVHTPGGHWRIPKASFISFLRERGMHVPAHLQQDTCRILVVDDDPAICEFVQSAFEIAPVEAEVACAYDGYSGLVKVGKMRPDLLVLDVMLPGIDGIEVLRRLRADPDLAGDMRILVVTAAHGNDLIMRKLAEASLDLVLYKPFSLRAFLDAALPLLEGPQARERKSA